ncbi:carboxylesterase/lipase family protein [Aspergillus saccharolyticus JOP 1030-1]|uniref:Carboxylic ester hydrolase n=1 Tax=Aspergillus saccharolyticus JOP 1030-1 TaxID=1450539 RepID=A0A318YYX6_9EURO|nr:alpha/beta-hydrolase [Aspergillus saccharolyticus JOP 1030-1]PYH40211.1 alpha/beta-hydrolase [Aspergillus saccharolyticus JOP 1030-1]
MWLTTTAATAATVLYGLSPVASAALYDSVVQTKYGKVQGYPAFNETYNGNLTHWKDITVWKGIPFAATTGGQNRWKAPQPASPWNGTLDAKEFGDVCPSATDGDNDYTITEDCLNLNIWSPAHSSSDKLPVVMWSYPALSTARDALFDGGGMADQGIVFVNYNYRTGSFGWMATPELSEEFEKVTGSNSSGNWGMLDQFAALKWIKANIANFGGDPDHITVMGQSAGSAATQHILNSNLTRGLIVGAIIESGVRYPEDPMAMEAAEAYRTLDVSYNTAEKFMASLNVSTIAEARELPMSDLVTNFLTSPYSFTATLDYYAIPETYWNTLRNKIAQDVPVLTGNTKDESGATYGLNISLETYYEDFNSTFSGEWLQRFLDLYPANDRVTASGAENSQWTDRSKIGTWLWSQMWNAAYESPIYNYYWDHAPPGQDQGAYHESEINYVLNNLYATSKPWTAADYAIAKKMNSYWANFIKTGNPNGPGLTPWPAVNSSELVQHVGDGWGQIPVGWSEKVALFKAWFSTLKKY